MMFGPPICRSTCNLFIGHITLQFVVREFRPYFTGITLRFSSTTNTTQILQRRKEMEYDNNEH